MPSKMSTHGKLSQAKQNRMPTQKFAFPKQRKEPLTDARHVQNALARFDQVEDVSDKDRDEAFRRIKQAAKKYHVTVEEKSWRDLGKNPHTMNPIHKTSHTRSRSTRR